MTFSCRYVGHLRAHPFQPPMGGTMAASLTAHPFRAKYEAETEEGASESRRLD